MLGFIVAKNSCPIVLIHGFMGWGEDEMGNYNYWGGKSDYVQMLTDQGHSVYEVSVGPVSSNWERAVEVYYQLKGGQVDYGKNHSKKYSIIQKPKNKNYKGLYPQWDASNPIPHFKKYENKVGTYKSVQFCIIPFSSPQGDCFDRILFN